MSESGRYCCKSPKLPGCTFPAVRRSDRRPPIYVVSIALPRSPVSLSSGDEVPHIFTRKSRLQPVEFLITSAKRLLQQYLPGPDSCSAAKSLPQREEGAVTSASDSRYCLSACAFSAINSASLRKVITATLRVR